jgi:hypothetical protein
VPTIMDMKAEAAKLTMSRGRTPQMTFAARKGTAQLASYRAGVLLLSKSAGKGHWETHPVDKLVYVFEGTVTWISSKRAGPNLAHSAPEPWPSFLRAPGTGSTPRMA